MKKKWLSVLLVIMCLLMIIPIISSCSCQDEEEPDDTSSSSGDSGLDDDTEQNIPAGDVKPVVKYLRVDEIGANAVTVKFNVICSDEPTYEVRYSASEITEENFESATKVEATVAGDGEIKTVVVPVTASKTQKSYIAVRAINGEEVSELATLRAGGIDLVYLDLDRADVVYLGENNGGANELIDEQDSVGNPLYDSYLKSRPTSRIGKRYYARGEIPIGSPNTVNTTHERYAKLVAPIVDLGYYHYVDQVGLYFNDLKYYHCESCGRYFYDVQFASSGICPTVTNYDADGDGKEGGTSDRIICGASIEDYKLCDIVVRASKTPADFQTPSEWEFTYTIAGDDIKRNGWNYIKIEKEIKYIQVEFVDGADPVELIVYGYETGECPSEKIGETQRQVATMGEMMGMCALLGSGAGYCSPEQLACSYVVREYHNVGWSYSISNFPKKSTSLINTVVGNFDALYARFSREDLLIIPCLQWSDSSNPARTYDYDTGKLSGTVASWDEKYDPDVYIAYADLIYQYAARYGSSKMGYVLDNILAHSDAVSATAQAGLGYIKWIELGNEPNGEDAAGATPYQLAALTSAAYDGHMRTILADVYNPNALTYFLGGKNADPDINLAVAGLAGVQTRYTATMIYWFKCHRQNDDGFPVIAMDAINVHTYFGKYFTLNGQQIIVGVSPEEYGLVDALASLIEYRNKYYPELEIWLTEFGWDTNQSYETMTSAHAYGTPDLNGDGEISEWEKVKRSREIQGMWLVRAYLLLNSCGVDKATMYECEDVSGANEETSIGKYGTCGIWANAFLRENDVPVSFTLQSGKKVQIAVLEGAKTYTDANGDDVYLFNSGYYLESGVQYTFTDFKDGKCTMTDEKGVQYFFEGESFAHMVYSSTLPFDDDYDRRTEYIWTKINDSEYTLTKSLYNVPKNGGEETQIGSADVKNVYFIPKANASNAEIDCVKEGYYTLEGTRAYQGENNNITIERKMEAKDGYYYMYTLYRTLHDYRFYRELASGHDDVWVYEFRTDDGKVAYAVWCPTSNGTVVENFKIKIDGDGATHVVAQNGETHGVSTDLNVGDDGYVTITVTENPSYVLVD